MQAVCSEVAGERVTFDVSSDGGQSSSLLPLGPHAAFHPTIAYTGAQSMITTTVGQLIAEHGPKRVPNPLVVDAQDADPRVLPGATKSLPFIDGVLVEASEVPLYEGGCTLKDITTFLDGFDLHPRWLTLDCLGHGEAFYSRPKPKLEHLPIYGGHLAVKRPTQQSSLSAWSYADGAIGPSGGVDGGITGGFGFHTDIEDAPWWQVDLEEVRPLTEVRVYNRMDSGRERSRTLQVMLSDDAEAWRLVHDQGGYTFGGADGRPLRIMLAGDRARDIRLRLAERTYLHLDKVQIF